MRLRSMSCVYLQTYSLQEHFELLLIWTWRTYTCFCFCLCVHLHFIFFMSHFGESEIGGVFDLIFFFLYVCCACIVWLFDSAAVYKGFCSVFFGVLVDMSDMKRPQTAKMKETLFKVIRVALTRSHIIVVITLSASISSYVTADRKDVTSSWSKTISVFGRRRLWVHAGLMLMLWVQSQKNTSDLWPKRPEL